MSSSAHLKHILVTGGNKGIGLAIASSLLHEHDDTCVIIGARDVSRGEAARASIIGSNPHLAQRCSVVQLDVTDNASVSSAAAALADRKLYGLVNNAGLASISPRITFDTNLFGVMSVTKAFLPHSPQRIVNVSSGVAPSFVAKCTPARQAVLTKPAASVDAVTELAEEYIAALEGAQADGGAALARLGYPPADAQAAYGASKSFLNLYTLTLAHQFITDGAPIIVSACSPGFIDTDLTRSFMNSPSEAGALQPAAATKVMNHLLFSEGIGSGYYFGSDAKRSPLDRYRDPGEPEYQD